MQIVKQKQQQNINSEQEIGPTLNIESFLGEESLLLEPLVLSSSL